MGGWNRGASLGQVKENVKNLSEYSYPLTQANISYVSYQTTILQPRERWDLGEYQLKIE